MLPQTTLNSDQARIRTISKAAFGWGIPLWPPSIAAIEAIGATLKEAGYRSANGYLMSYKTTAQRSGWEWGELLHRSMKDTIRSCERGQGPPIQAQPLPLR